MATIRRRNKKWQAQVRQKNYKSLSRTFIYKNDALQWAKETETGLQKNYLEYNSAQLPSFSKIIDKYINLISTYKRGAGIEIIRLRALQKENFTKLPFNQISPKIISEYRDKRLQKVQSSTFLRELNTIQHIFNIANKEWCINIKNPIKNIVKPKITQKRERRLTTYEYNFLVTGNYNQQCLRDIIEIALETGMRRGEILSIHINDISSQILTINQTKNGCSRKIPLTKRALYILNNTKLPFPYTPNALKLAWNRLKKKGNIKDLHFHDLRHEAISRFFEKGLSIPEVALISGHKDVRMLFRYTHLKAINLLKRI
jgi:integrase